MNTALRWALLAVPLYATAAAGGLDPSQPTWWDKFLRLEQNGPMAGGERTTSASVGANLDVSNECGPQSETYVTLNPGQPATLTGGSNEIFRLPMRAYFSSDGGASWGGVDVPLPPPLNGTHDTRFGSDPTLAFDTQGNVFYGFIVVFFGNGAGVNGTEIAVARSSDGGRNWPQLTTFSFSSGTDHFNDKPMIAADTNARSPFKDNVYIAWDAASGGSSGGGIRLGRSSDHGATFSVARIDDRSGPGRGIGAIPFVGPNGEVYAAWNDFAANTIAFNRSFDGGVTWGAPGVISAKQLAFQARIPAQSFRGALVYPSCDADRSGGEHAGRLVCSWMDLNASGNTDIFTSFSDEQGATWSPPLSASDRLSGVDRFNHWLSIDSVTGDVTASFYDTRNDTTGARFMTDVFFAKSTTGGASWLPNLRVTDMSSNEHDCSGIFPCPSIDYGNQYGDYEGLVSFGGVSHPIWTDSRRNREPVAGCPSSLMEEVFSATIAR